jgi:hypothetical protein
MLADPGDVDGSEWDSLARASRMSLGTPAHVLQVLPKHLPDTVRPREVTAALALGIEAALLKEQRPAFRRGLVVLDQLQDQPLAIATGLLPLQRVTVTRVPDLPPRLELLGESANGECRRALRLAWKLALAAKIYGADDDPEDHDLAAQWSKLVALDPADFGFAVQRDQFGRQLAHLANLFVRRGLRDPRRTEVEWAWDHLHAELRRAGIRRPAFYELARRAQESALAPQELTPEWIAEALSKLPMRKARAFRSDCYRMDKYRESGLVSADLLSLRATGLSRRESRRPPTPPEKAKDPVKEAWSALTEKARAEGFTKNQIDNLSPLRSRAKAVGLAPQEVTGAWLRDLIATQGSPDARRLKTAVGQLNRFRSSEGLRPLLPNDELLAAWEDPLDPTARATEALVNELSSVLDLMGYKAVARREMKRALCTLIDRVGAAPELRLLLDRDLEAVDWKGCSGAASHVRCLKRAKNFIMLPWTAGWRELQALVATADVPSATNPVPKLLAHAEGREPWELDADWAGEIDRNYRRMGNLSRHGRADLALTFEANIRRFDALHKIPAIATSGFLPKLIGNYRQPAPSGGSRSTA